MSHNSADNSARSYRPSWGLVASLSSLTIAALLTVGRMGYDLASPEKLTLHEIGDRKVLKQERFWGGYFVEHPAGGGNFISFDDYRKVSPGEDYSKLETELERLAQD